MIFEEWKVYDVYFMGITMGTWRKKTKGVFFTEPPVDIRLIYN
jgi:phage terminase large subunit-like protein